VVTQPLLRTTTSDVGSLVRKSEREQPSIKVITVKFSEIKVQGGVGEHKIRFSLVACFSCDEQKDGGSGGANIFCINVLLPQRGGAVPAPLVRGGPKWRDNFPEGSTILPPDVVSFRI